MTGLSRQFSGFKGRCSVHLPDDTFLTCEGLFVALCFDYLRLLVIYLCLMPQRALRFFFQTLRLDGCVSRIKLEC